MGNKTIEISRERVLETYATARELGHMDAMCAMESLFGKDTFRPEDVMERVKTFDDALKELGDDNQLVKEYYERWQLVGDKDVSKDYVAYLKLRIVCAALNEGWEPQFTKDETRYYPWFWFYTKEEIDEMSADDRTELNMKSTDGYQTEYAGFVCAYSYAAPSRTNASIGSRLCLKSDALAKYCGRQFTDIWADFLLIRKGGLK